MKEKKLLYGLIEELGNDVFFNKGKFDRFEDAVIEREFMQKFTENKIFIIQRLEVDKK